MRGQIYNYEDYHKEINNNLYKKCIHHEEFFPEENEWLPCTSDYFYVNDKNNSDGLHPECKKCGSIKALNWKRNNPKKTKNNAKRYRNKPLSKKNKRISEQKRRDEGKHRQWQHNNKDKVKNANNQHQDHKISLKEWKGCKGYFHNTCAYCGLPIEQHFYTRLGITKLGDFHKEHVIDGGRNDLKNCIPSCRSCNSSKHETSFNNWYNKNNPIFSQERYHKIYIWIRYDYKKFIQEKKVRSYNKKQSA